MNTESTWICESNTFFETTVRGSKGDTYHVIFGASPNQGVKYEWSCTCKGFSYNKKCRHIEEVKISGKWCGWNQDMEVLPKPEQGGCPRCHGPIRGILVTV